MWADLRARILSFPLELNPDLFHIITLRLLALPPEYYIYS
jgi:hypothetical protein